MRYAIVTETYPPEVNGVALTVQGLEQGLRSRGHAVSLVRPRQESDVADLPDTLLVRGAALPRYPGLKFGLPATRRLTRLWTNTPPDAIYVATEGPLGWSAVRAAKRLGIPVATGFHTRFDEYMRDYGAAFLQQTAMRWMRRFHNRADATLVPTRELQDFLASQGFERVVRLARAVDSTQFSPTLRDTALRTLWGARADTPVAIYVGRIAAEKNLALAVRAFAPCRASAPMHASSGSAMVRHARSWRLKTPTLSFAAFSAAKRWRGTLPVAICSCSPATAKPSATSPWKRWPAVCRR